MTPKVSVGFHRIEVQITPNEWVHVVAGDYWFGQDYADTLHSALEKARWRLADLRRQDAKRAYRLITQLNPKNS